LGDLDPRIAQETRKASNFIVWLFAIVGFVAAIVQILSYFSTGGSQLRVRITPHEGIVEGALLKAVQDGPDEGSVTQIADDEHDFYCRYLKSENRSPQQAKEDNDRCARADALNSFVRLVRGYDGTTKYFDYQIENVGSSTANQIRLSGNDIYAVETVKPSPYSGRIDQRPGENFYRLPGINPGETLLARVWSTDSRVMLDSEWLSTSDFPIVTYEGGRAHLSLNKLTPAFYSDLHGFLSDFPLPITIIIVLAVATVVGIIVLIFLTVVATLLKGGSVAAVFKPAASPVEPAEPTPVPKEAA
jgi:hypothetical protein